jgi:hypothetical protein
MISAELATPSDHPAHRTSRYPVACVAEITQAVGMPMKTGTAPRSRIVPWRVVADAVGLAVPFLVGAAQATSFETPSAGEPLAYAALARQAFSPT